MAAKVLEEIRSSIIAIHYYSFNRDELIKSIPSRKSHNDEQFKKSAVDFFNHIIQLADNSGSTDEHEHRALNYLAVRYDEICNRTQLMQNENYSFSAVEVRLSRLSGARKIVDAIFSYENRKTALVEKWFTRVDVTEEFQFLVSPLQQYYDR
jgi:hypothetical protein